jgi:hypothetical protein
MCRSTVDRVSRRPRRAFSGRAGTRDLCLDAFQKVAPQRRPRQVRRGLGARSRRHADDLRCLGAPKTCRCPVADSRRRPHGAMAAQAARRREACWPGARRRGSWDLRCLHARVLPGLQRAGAAAQRHRHAQDAPRLRECGPTLAAFGPLREHQRTPVLRVHDAQSTDCLHERTVACLSVRTTHRGPHRLHVARHHSDAMNSSMGIAANDW